MSYMTKNNDCTAAERNDTAIRKKAMDTKKHIFSVSMIAILALIIAGYLGIAFYYTQGFSFGTWINGIYCTGKSVEEVNALLAKQPEARELNVAYPFRDGKKLSEEAYLRSRFELDGSMVTQDYTKPLQKLLMRQKPLLWFENLLEANGGYEVLPEIALTEEGKKQLEEQFLSGKEVQAEQKREAVIRLKPDEKLGFVLYDGKSNRLNVQNALAECIAAIETGEESIVLSENCYDSEELDVTEKEQVKLYEELLGFLDFELVYDMGSEQVRFDRKALSGLLAVEKEGSFDFVRDESGEFTWDEEQVGKAVDKLADTYDTYGKPREYETTEGSVVKLEKGTYGTELDRQAEKEWLYEALKERRSQKHIPAYKREAWVRGKNDIGDTFVEINLTKQNLLFYLDGKLEIDTPIVTGDMLRHRETPEGVYFIYAKQKNRILRGPGYASHVNYWMPVKGGVGIHDALWRDEFGGGIYEKDGSHGCINIPLEAAEELYGMAEVGMPVIIYKEEKP